MSNGATLPATNKTVTSNAVYATTMKAEHVQIDDKHPPSQPERLHPSLCRAQHSLQYRKMPSMPRPVRNQDFGFERTEEFPLELSGPRGAHDQETTEVQHVLPRNTCLERAKLSGHNRGVHGLVQLRGRTIGNMIPRRGGLSMFVSWK